MNPKYSIILANQSLQEYETKIEQWLANGIKVLWFGKEDAVIDLKARFSAYHEAYIFQVYEVNSSLSGIIIDGNGDDELLSWLEATCPSFNGAQYRVEHCRASENILVQASAGTGKTTVMIDRIMYLLHTQDDLSLNEIYMITFTSDAAEQMNSRLQDVLMTRYLLTKNNKYLCWVEEQSQMQISTIHSFAYYLLKKLGIGEGFTKGLALRNFDHEKREIIKDAIDEKLDGEETIHRQLGVPFYRANDIISSFWGKFSQMGVSHGDLLEMDWGKAENEESESFHKMIKEMVAELDDRYFELKRREEAIAINDIMRDLQEVLIAGNIPNSDITMKYLFIDEFQDSDLSQIKVSCLLSKLMGAVLFVVGDVKQSIYRFRGATDKAFEIFIRDLSEMDLKAPVVFQLVNNYRTAKGVMNRMDDYFACWGRDGVLNYDKPVVPFNETMGSMKMLPSQKKETTPEQLAEIVSYELDQLIEKVNSSGKEPKEKNRVVVLTRSNKELVEVGRILERAKIPASVRQDGALFESDAARDFYMMVSSFMFCDEPKYIFNYLLTPYAGDIELLNINDMEHLNGDYESLVGYLDHFLNQTSWKKYHKELRLKPVMSVLKDMIDDKTLMESVIALHKRKREIEGWEERRINADTFSYARQYRANIEKLMGILNRGLRSDKNSLYDIYSFLKHNVATNRSESEAMPTSKDDYTSVLCMTIHKSKGLEYDTIIIPYTNQHFGGKPRTELLVDPVKRKVGWHYAGDREKMNRHYKYFPMKNDNYDDLQLLESRLSQLEGVRVLYVGMTRAIENLICIAEDSKDPMSWAKLIKEVGLDNE